MAPHGKRRWPAGTDRERVQFIHTVLTHVVAQGIAFVPAPIPTRSVGEGALLQFDHHLWDLSPWLPGTPDYHARSSRPRLAAAMQALANFHSAAASCPIAPTTSGIAPAFAERRDQVLRLLSGGIDRIASHVERGLAEDLDLRARRLLPLARALLPHLRAPLEAACRDPLPLRPAIRDVHHDHVLFTGERVTGLIDFGAMRIDTPLADIARLVGSLVADDQPARVFALNAYSELRPLTDSDRRLVDLLDQSGVVLGGLNWLRWLYVEQRDMGPLPPIVKRLDEFIARLV
jgi:homoserine kinase type II